MQNKQTASSQFSSDIHSTSCFSRTKLRLTLIFGGALLFPLFFLPTRDKIIRYVYNLELYVFPTFDTAPLSIAISLTYFLSISIYGYVLFEHLFRNTRTHPLIRLFASFLLGYLCSIPINRIVTLILPGQGAALFLFFLYFLFAIALTPLFFRKKMRNFGAVLRLFDWKSTAVYILLIVALFFFFLIWRLHFPRGHYLTGHANKFYIGTFLDMMTGSGFLKRFDHHYDELLFLFPLLAFPIPKPDLSFFYWLMLAFGKTSAVLLLYSFVRRLHISHTLSCACVGLMFFGTPWIIPIVYAHFSDSMHPPLAFCPHLGRVLSAIIPALLLVLIRNWEALSRIKNPAKTIGSLLLLASGISSLPIQNSFYSVLILCAVIFYSMFNLGKKQIRQFSDYLAVAAIILALLLTHSDISIFKNLHGQFLLGASFLGFTYIVFYPSLIKTTQPSFVLKPQIRIILLFLLFLTVSSCTMGNIGTQIFQRILESLFSLFGLEIHFETLLSRATTTYDLIRFFHSPPKPPSVRLEMVPWFDAPTILRFVSIYGTMLLSVPLSLWIIHRANATQHCSALKANLQLFRFFLLCCLCSIPLAFFLVDFVHYGGDSILSTRFLEGPYYFTIFLLFVIVGKFADRDAHAWLILYAFIWSFWPFIAHSRPQQWMANLQVFLRLF